MVTWEAVQKNFLSELERRRKDSGEELPRKTAHRCGTRPARPTHLGGRGRRPGALSPRGGLQGQGPSLERWPPPLQGAGK